MLDGTFRSSQDRSREPGETLVLQDLPNPHGFFVTLGILLVGVLVKRGL